MKAFTDKIKYAQGVWEAEDKRINSQTKSMEGLRKAMDLAGQPVHRNQQDEQLIMDKGRNDMKLKSTLMKIMMGG